MPYIFMREYDLTLMDLNRDLYQIYIESHAKSGGERRVVSLRQNEKGLPLTLRDNYTDSGFLNSATESRDIQTVESELQTISRLSVNGVNVCVPMSPLANELVAIEKLSPRLAGYLKKRLNSVGLIL